MNTIKGKVWNFGANIDTDIIIAARYLNSSDPEFPKKLSKGDIIVAGENFGCGSSREHAPIALKAAGVAAVVAPSFARIFYRNAFNMGLPIFELPESLEIKEGEEISINLDEGEITNLTTNKTYKFIPIPPFMQELIASGGLINYAKAEMTKGN
jgi:3-isopropylmalate/(R)-2-methylmalate dehydratase small subunit